MINAEYWKERLLEIAENNADVAMVNGKLVECGEVDCSRCGFNNNKLNCSAKFIKWLLAEHKEPYKITLLEKMILEKLSKKYDYIARNEEGNLYVYTGLYEWTRVSASTAFIVPRDIVSFSFIKWEDEKPIEISDILENCELVEEQNN